MPGVHPAAEQDWQYAAALSATSVQQLVASGGLELVQPLQQAAALLAPAIISGIGWSGKVFATHNFLHTTAEAGAAGAPLRGSLNAYLRPADSLLLLPRQRRGAAAVREGGRGAAGAGHSGWWWRGCCWW